MRSCCPLPSEFGVHGNGGRLVRLRHSRVCRLFSSHFHLRSATASEPLIYQWPRTPIGHRMLIILPRAGVIRPSAWAVAICSSLEPRGCRIPSGGDSHRTNYWYSSFGLLMGRRLTRPLLVLRVKGGQFSLRDRQVTPCVLWPIATSCRCQAAT